jgi:two-component system response regulator RegA
LRFLIVDDNCVSGNTLARQLISIGHEVWLTDDLKGAIHVVQTHAPDIVITELRPGGEHWHRLLACTREICPSPSVVIATSYGSVATAIRAIKLGAAAFLAKPVTAWHVLAELQGDHTSELPTPPQHLTLDRAIWEYINLTVEAAGSISEAARRLGVDRRSLRRMLAKYAPSR